MPRLRTGLIVLTLGVGFAAVLAGAALTVGVQREAAVTPAAVEKPKFAEVKWPFPMDQWGRGRAFQCSAADCGIEVTVYVRAKIGFCNCDSGVADDAELDRVGDMELYSQKFIGIGDGRTIKVGWMEGRSRPYRADVPYVGQRTAQVIAFNEQCDVIVATVVTRSDRLGDAERLALVFLNGDIVLNWARAELGAA